MRRATRVSGVSSGAALLLAFTGTTAAAAPHAPVIERISTAADGTQADGPSNDAAISAVRQLISVDRWGGRNDLPAGKPSVNADGTVVAFEWASPDLVAGDTNGVSDVFLRTAR
ncbi:hypothetical protein ABZ078_03300 [Streptomyces sp. NPDC006385]|uniref:hypothetical protein n=1 Tax=Streptomyces sp. NPDC006385 TaxID=3156761 RepID=UPI0033A643F8